jgi:hypothetical protein
MRHILQSRIRPTTMHLEVVRANEFERLLDHPEHQILQSRDCRLLISFILVPDLLIECVLIV